MSGKIRLDKRLSAIMDMVRPGSVVADIGTDHGYLACALAETGLASRVFACDANPLPLERAKKNIEKNCLSGKVETVLTNGLNDLPHSLIDTIVIAGMGGDLISEILLAHRWTRDTHFHFILQPMTKPEKLRKALYKNGFTIRFERSIISVDKVYTVMSVVYTDRISQHDIVTCYIGAHFYNNQLESIIYIKHIIQQLEKKAAGISMSKNPDKAKKYIEAAHKIRERISL